MGDAGLRFAHRYLPPSDPGSGTTMLLLHGTGGDEDDLLPVGAAVAPGAGCLSPRGKVIEQGMARFFRRLRPGVFDLEDLAARTAELAAFVEAAATAYGFDPAAVVAVGYSNGANIGGSLLLRRPGLLSAAVLFRAMVPFEPQEPPVLSGKQILLAAGRRDPVVPPAETERLARLYRECGAEVSLHWGAGGHELTEEDVRAARDWLSGWRAGTGS